MASRLRLRSQSDSGSNHSKGWATQGPNGHLRLLSNVREGGGVEQEMEEGRKPGGSPEFRRIGGTFDQGTRPVCASPGL
jgi:hypothetical protein